MKKFTHIDNQNPAMVDVGEKAVTTRTAIAQSLMELPKEIVDFVEDGEIKTLKGPVFQTAIIAGVQAAKKTAELIPLCHNLFLSKVKIDIQMTGNNLVKITCEAKTEGKTGVEMEALTGASVAALTVYDMCKELSHNIIIKETRLIKKTGGKSNFENAWSTEIQGSRHSERNEVERKNLPWRSGDPRGRTSLRMTGGKSDFENLP